LWFLRTLSLKITQPGLYHRTFILMAGIAVWYMKRYRAAAKTEKKKEKRIESGGASEQGGEGKELVSLISTKVPSLPDEAVAFLIMLKDEIWKSWCYVVFGWLVFSQPP
jgi:hypothetical protein